MIKFFRKIRQRMLGENKFSKYLLYALGEILLVVIGILIALWINSSYESQQNAKSERAVLADVKTEFIENQTALKVVMEKYEERQEDVQLLSGYISPTPKFIRDGELDTLIFWFTSIPAYELSQETVNSISSSGKMALIRNRKISYKIAATGKYYGEYVKWMELNNKQVYEEILPYISDKYPLKRLAHLVNPSDMNASSFVINKEVLLSDMRFESIVANRMLDIRALLNSSQRLLDHQTAVIKMIEKELGQDQKN